MIIELMRADTPEEVGRQAECAICERPFRTEVIIATPWTTDGGTDMGDGRPACPACVEALGRYLPGKFPTLEEYEAAKRRYPEPLFGSQEEAQSAWDRRRDPHGEIVAALRIERTSR